VELTAELQLRFSGCKNVPKYPLGPERNNAIIRKYAHPNRLLLMAVFLFTPNLVSNNVAKII
jgi:hypothetical protein